MKRNKIRTVIKCLSLLKSYYNKEDINKYNICKENNIKLFYFTFNNKYDKMSYIDNNNFIYTDIKEQY